MDLRERLQTIYDEYGGQLTPSIVLKEARSASEDDVLRTGWAWDWDKDEAAEKWLKKQAHELIQSIRVTYVDERGHRRDIRHFYAVRRGAKYNYEPVDTVVQDDLLTKMVLADMERDWRTLMARYDQFAEFHAMVQRDVGAA